MRLLLMRHANTEINHQKTDFERTLTDIGKEEANKAADFLIQYQIDKTIVSYVKRTIQTANIIQDKVPIEEMEIVEELYKSTEEDFINLLTLQEDRNKHILVIGHNPLIYNIIIQHVESEGKYYNLLLTTMMPPARIVVVDFNDISSWQQFNKTTQGKIVEIFSP